MRKYRVLQNFLTLKLEPTSILRCDAVLTQMIVIQVIPR